MLERIDGVNVPTSFAALCAAIPDVDLATLVDRLPRRAASRDDALRAVMEAVEQRWDRMVASLLEVIRRGRADSQAAAFLDDLAGREDWRNLAAAVDRVLEGERDVQSLTAGLDEVDTDILTEVLRRLEAEDE